ncbi:TPA-induced transmembrane protein isoform X1 [Erpetoichthys calabaricus]|uniref:TPA-induced transmembrane protein n=1 Tax=Erpetoichthys calabaricus TaxID=27687 RepID=A0A8C4RP04_ERPCA|nr:TPA-induced transmembrane protein isoform X1 [Erpetoichthys calabaricus]
MNDGKEVEMQIMPGTQVYNGQDHGSNSDECIPLQSMDLDTRTLPLETTNSLSINCEAESHQPISNRGKKRCYSKSKLVCWKLKLWHTILLIILLFLLAIVISLVLYSVVYEDEDEKFDKQSYITPHNYNGTLRVINCQGSTESPQHQFESTCISQHLRDMLLKLYRSSPLLGRYFVDAYSLPNGTNDTIAYYRLQFQVPEENTLLLKYTLNEEVVVNIFRQHLYDQEFEENRVLVIDPASLSIHVAD